MLSSLVVRISRSVSEALRDTGLDKAWVSDNLNTQSFISNVAKKLHPVENAHFSFRPPPAPAFLPCMDNVASSNPQDDAAAHNDRLPSNRKDAEKCGRSMAVCSSD